MNKFDSKSFIMIYQFISSSGYEVHECTHIGDNVFEINYTDQQAPLAGSGYIGTFTYKEDKVVKLKSKMLWMS